MTSVSRLLGEALGERSENVVLSRAYHGHTVLLVADVAKFVDAFGGGSTLLSLFGHHGFEQVGNVLHLGRLGWNGSRLGLKDWERDELIEEYPKIHFGRLGWNGNRLGLKDWERESDRSDELIREYPNKIGTLIKHRPLHCCVV